MPIQLLGKSVGSIIIVATEFINYLESISGFQDGSQGMRLEGFCRPVSRVLYLPRMGKTVTIYLAQTPAVKPADVRF
ncbi:MAG: hypothetical protein VYA78_07380, partial [Chloroflexota bacterium]|nr:hypothetical protein [Chloroflexota bacterium]